MKVPAVPPPTVISPEAKPVTVSEKVKVKVTSPFAVPMTLSVMITLGSVVSITIVLRFPRFCPPGIELLVHRLPAKSV